jgi:hypothetical protein
VKCRAISQTFSKPHAQLLSKLVESFKTGSVIYAQSIHRALELWIMEQFQITHIHNVKMAAVLRRKQCLVVGTFSKAHSVVISIKYKLKTLYPA